MSTFGGGYNIKGGALGFTIPPSTTTTYTIPATDFFILTAIDAPAAVNVGLDAMTTYISHSTFFNGGLYIGPLININMTNTSGYVAANVELFGVQYTNQS